MSKLWLCFHLCMAFCFIWSYIDFSFARFSIYLIIYLIMSNSSSSGNLSLSQRFNRSLLITVNYKRINSVPKVLDRKDFWSNFMFWVFTHIQHMHIWICTFKHICKYTYKCIYIPQTFTQLHIYVMTNIILQRNVLIYLFIWIIA